VALDEPKYWAARLDDSDRTVPLRTWVTEIGAGLDSNGDTLFGTRLICATRGADEPFERSVPSFVKAIIAAGPVELDGVLVTRTARLVSTDADVHELLELLENPARSSDVIVVSLPEGSTNPTEAAIAAQEVHKKLLGIAHVVVITGPASFTLTNSVGKELSVFRGGIRNYRPGFRAWLDDPLKHPLALPQRIEKWEEIGSSAFERWIVNQGLANSVRGAERERQFPSFNTVRQLAAQAERAQLINTGGSEAELLKLFDQDNEKLRKELREQKEQDDGLLALAEAEREAAIQEASNAKAQALDRLHRIKILEQRLAQVVEKQPPNIPEDLSGFEEWCKEYLVGSVELVSRAFQGVRKSEYHDPSFIYRSLILLRDFYVPMRIEGSRERRDDYLKALQDLELEDSATGDAIKYSPDLYSVQYAGKRCAMDRHLKGSNSRDRRFGFRLYFFWDEESQIVVVGWLPSHLDNRAS